MIAAGFTAPKGNGYWTAVNAFCAQHGIAYPASPRMPVPPATPEAKPAPAPKAPTAAEIAAVKREALLVRKRRERITAAKA